MFKLPTFRFARSFADGSYMQQTYLDGIYLPLELEDYQKKDPIVVIIKYDIVIR